MAKAAEAFRTISEVAEELDLHKHVLRFWEVKFPQIKPMKRGGGRRYYRPADMELLRGIRHLLHAEGYTIKGVQKILRERGIDAVKRVGSSEVAANGKGEAPAAAVMPAGHGDGAATAISDAAMRQPAKSGRTGDAPAPARASERQSTRRRTLASTAPASRTQDILRAIAELEACRAILAGASAMPSSGTADAKSKRAMRAAG